jgi:O-antigen/teichoic acid export membrane protein
MAVFPDFFIMVLYGSTAKMPWFIVAIIGIPANVLFQMNNSVLAGMKNMIAYGIFKNIVIFGVGLLIFFIGQNTVFPLFVERFMGSGILVLASYVLAIYLGLFFNSIQVVKKLELFKSITRTKIEDVNLVKEGFPLMLTASMSLVITTTDYFMLSHFYSQVEIGMYDIVVKISILTAIILVAVNAIATPKFAEFSKHKDLKSLRIIVSQSSKLIFWGSFPVLIITLLFPQTVLSLFGEEFMVASNALIFLSLGQFVNSICGSVGNLLKMTNYQFLFQNIVIVAAIINIILNLSLIPNYGINGAAFASFISISFLNLTAAYFAFKKLKVRTIYLPIIFS